MQEHDSVLNKILTEMDGFKTTDNVVVFASTNMMEKLDKALLRSGRFDTKIVVDYPSRNERKEILDLYLKKIKLEESIEYNELVERFSQKTVGLTGADINNFINQAGIQTVLDGREKVGLKDLNSALDNMTIGNERRSKKLSDDELRTVAYHEAGHALIGYMMKDANSPIKISIVPRGMGALGYTQPGTTEQSLYTKEQLYARVHTLYGGRVAEQVEFGVITSGASDDIEKATKTMTQMLSTLGMGTMGPQYYCLNRQEDMVSDTKRMQIEDQVNVELQKTYDRVVELMKTHHVDLKRLAEKLLEEENMDQPMIEEILGSELENSVEI